jgi:hypothetical protein
VREREGKRKEKGGRRRKNLCPGAILSRCRNHLGFPIQSSRKTPFHNTPPSLRMTNLGSVCDLLPLDTIQVSYFPAASPSAPLGSLFLSKWLLANQPLSQILLQD